jgi:hypothetical protein
MMLSNRMTANNLELNPASQASARTRKTMRLLEPTGFIMAELLDTVSMAVSLTAPGPGYDGRLGGQLNVIKNYDQSRF